MIERYLHELGLYLPKENKEDILREVQANIYDMLGDDQSSENIDKVLCTLGNPRILAQEYYPKKRYLIGPYYYDIYINFLKYSVLIAGSVFAVIKMFENILQSNFGDSSVKNFTTIFGGVLTSFIDGAWYYIIMVTIIFIILEKKNYTLTYEQSSKTKLSFKKTNQWTPKQLKPLKKQQKYSYRKSSIIADIFFTGLMTALFVGFYNYIGWYQKDGLMIELFNPDRFKIYSVFIIITALFYIGIKIMIWKQKHQNYLNSTVLSVYKILGFGVFLMMVFDRQLITEEFKNKVISVINITSLQLYNYYNITAIIISVIIFGLIVISIGQLFYKSYINAQQIDNGK